MTTDEMRERERLYHQEKNRKHKLRKHGLTPAAYDALVERQGGGCAVCGALNLRNGRIWDLCVDHDHETGEVRGLLCHRCNTALGQADDDATTLRAMADYLETH